MPVTNIPPRWEPLSVSDKRILAEIAGNIVGHLVVRETDSINHQSFGYAPSIDDVKGAVWAARAILAEIERTDASPKADTPGSGTKP